MPNVRWLRIPVSILLAFALLVGACGDSSQETDETSPAGPASNEGGDVGPAGRPVIAGVIDLAVIDPDNIIGDAEDCVVAALNEFLEDDVADLSADQTQWAFWVGDIAGKDCGVVAGLVLDPLSGGAHLGEGDLFGP